MMNYIWVAMVVIAIIVGIFNGTITDVTNSVFSFAGTAVEICIGLIGVMAFWLGLMKIADESGLAQKVGHFCRPVLKKLFPEIPDGHPAMSSIVMNIGANVLGLGNAATPFGLKAMKDMQTLNRTKTIATNAQVMLLAITTSSTTLIPTTVLAYRTAAKSDHPTIVVGPIILATIISTAVGIVAALIFQNAKRWKLENVIARERAAGTMEWNENCILEKLPEQLEDEARLHAQEAEREKQEAAELAKVKSSLVQNDAAPRDSSES